MSCAHFCWGCLWNVEQGHLFRKNGRGRLAGRHCPTAHQRTCPSAVSPRPERIVFAPVYHGPLKDYGFCHLIDGTRRDALSAAFIALSRRIDLRTAGMLRNLRLWSNRLGRPNAELAKPCPQRCCGSSRCHHTPCGDGLRRPGAARGAQAVAVRFNSARRLTDPSAALLGRRASRNAIRVFYGLDLGEASSLNAVRGVVPPPARAYPSPDALDSAKIW